MKIDSFILYSPCPCGSGKKFKFCHFETVRGNLPDDPSQSEVTTEVRKAMQPCGMVNGIDPVEDREALSTLYEGIRKRDSEGFGPALALFRRAREMKPNLFTAWNNEAQCLWYLNRLDEAVARQEEGLARSSDCNAFGWAQLAIMNHCLDRDSGRDLSLDRAMAIPPISADAAIKVCESLGLAARHRDIPVYVRDSGFADSAAVAFFAGIATANCGQPEMALKLLRLLPEDIPQRELVDRVVRDLSTKRKDAATPLGTWPYFIPTSYPGSSLVEKITGKDVGKYKNAACDIVEIMFAAGKLPADVAQGMLVTCGGTRAAALLDALGKQFPIPKEYLKPGVRKRTCGAAGEDGESRIQRRLISTAKFEDDPMDEKDAETFGRASQIATTARLGTKRFAKAKAELEALLERYPDHYRLQFNYASVLDRIGNRDEAIQIIEKIAAEHPQYVYAHAALIDIALVKGDLAKAGEVYGRFVLPNHIHPVELRAWYTTVLRYAKAAGLKKDAKFALENLKMIEKHFPDL